MYVIVLCSCKEVNEKVGAKEGRKRKSDTEWLGAIEVLQSLTRRREGGVVGGGGKGRRVTVAGGIRAVWKQDTKAPFSPIEFHIIT